jgi:hypothetical protein
VKEIVDPPMGGEETLRLAGWPEAFHLSFSPPGWLVRILRPVVQPFMLPMLKHSAGVPSWPQRSWAGP